MLEGLKQETNKTLKHKIAKLVLKIQYKKLLQKSDWINWILVYNHHKTKLKCHNQFKQPKLKLKFDIKTTTKVYT